MAFVIILIMLLIVLPKVSVWYNNWLTRREKIAEMTAIGLHRLPILVMSNHIGDTTVEERAAYIRQLLAAARHPILTPADVHVALYSPGDQNGMMNVEFEVWRTHVVNTHYSVTCSAWKQAKMSETVGVNGYEKLNKDGVDYLNAQRKQTRNFSWNG